jgi:uncharacterized integral membrane protein
MQQPKTSERRAYLSETEQVSTWARVKTAVGLVALGALILFLLQNFQETDIKFLWFEWTTRTIWALLGAAIAGAIATIVVGTLQNRARNRRP